MSASVSPVTQCCDANVGLTGLEAQIYITEKNSAQLRLREVSNFCFLGRTSI